MADLERMNLVITGHVDHGKSTSFGHMLFLHGQIHDPKKRRAPWRIAESYFKDSRAEGMASWSWAWILDPLIEERQRGLTINVAFQEFRTNEYIFNLIDAPGHSDFIKNMITGASQADAAILVISARKGEFEDGTQAAGTASGKYADQVGTTTEHMLLLVSLGITDIIVAINKMDTVDWDQDRYETIKKNIRGTLKTLMGALQVENAEEKLNRIQFVPTSGLFGVNLLAKEKTISNLEGHIAAAEAGNGDSEFIESIKKDLENIKSHWPDWYDGPSILEALDMIPSPSERKEELSKKSLRLPIQSILNVSGVGTVLTGRVATGILKPNTDVVIAPTKQSLKPTEISVKTIEEFHKELPQAGPGDNVGFNIKAKNLGAKDILRGAVVSDPTNPVKALRPNVDGFQAMLLVVRSLGKKDKKKDKSWAVHVNYTPVLHCGTAQVACRVTELKDLSGKEIVELGPNQRGMAWFTPIQPIVVESMRDSPTIGRFALRDSGKTVAVGIIEQIDLGRYGN